MRRPAFLSIVAVIAAAAIVQAQQPTSRFLNKPAKEWAKELKNASAENRRTAAFALGKIGADGATYTDELIRVLTDGDESVRETDRKSVV